ncbi:MAG: hypothetical protein JNJ60_22430, partial [Rhodocyclaceae bacterium]|nr:hypothetical protein [Rhodocyclaceae bacterium]
MGSFQSSMMALVAKERFARASLPSGANRNDFNTYLDALARAVAQAISQWQETARLSGVIINSVTAFGGVLVAPPLDPLIRSAAPGGSWDAYTRAIAAGLGNQMRTFESLVKVPGLPWYPSFAAVPCPVAPPTPNVPCSLMALSAAALPQLSESSVKSAIIAKFPNPKPAAGTDLAVAVAAGFEKAAIPWLGGTIVR